jgi:hypothetical protein
LQYEDIITGISVFTKSLSSNDQDISSDQFVLAFKA